MRVAGIMSGTSLDGIDVAIVEIRGAASSRDHRLHFDALSRRGARGHSRRLQLPHPHCRISRLNFQLAESVRARRA